MGAQSRTSGARKAKMSRELGLGVKTFPSSFCSQRRQILFIERQKGGERSQVILSG